MSGLTKSATGGGKAQPVSWLVIGLVVVMLCVMAPPIFYLVASSLHTTNPDGSFRDFTWRFYADLVANPRFGRNLSNTAIYAIGSACVAIVIGGVQAWIVERTDAPLRKYVFLISIVSLGIPSVLYTAAFLLLLGKTGPVNQIIEALTGVTQAVNVYSMAGMIIVEGIDFSPLSFLLLSAVFRSMDSSFEEAASMSGATQWQAFRRVTLMLALPGILALFLLIFIRAFESFETPALVGRPAGIPLITTEIFRATQVDSPPNYGQAGAYSVVLLVIVAALLAPALVTCWLYVFLSATKAVSLLILLAGPDTRVVAVAIFDLWADGSLTKLAAMGVAWSGFMGVLAGTFFVVARRYGVAAR